MNESIYKVEYWLNHPMVNNDEKNEYQKLNQVDKDDSFSKTLDFGTGGMRGIIGLGPNRINNIMIAIATFAYGKYIIGKAEQPTIIIGYDNRLYSKEFALSAALSLSSLKIKVILFDELMATPIVSYAIRKYQADGGIIITASHNPKEYNGYKVYDNTGCQLLPEEIIKVVSLFDYDIDFSNIQYNKNLITYHNNEIIDEYLDELTSMNHNLNPNISFAYSAQHGTGLRPVSKLIEKYQLNNAHILMEQSFEDKSFINTKCANPESIDAFEKLIPYGLKNNCKLLMTTDPDADRLGIAYLEEDTYKLLNGNQLGILLLDYLIKTNDTTNKYIVSTIVSTPLARIIAQENNIKYYEVLTGFKYIGDIINKFNEENFLFGFEESYGYLNKAITRDKDAIQIILLVLNMASYYEDKNLSIGQALDKIYHKYHYYLEDLISIKLGNIDIQAFNEIFNKLKNYEFKDVKESIDYEDIVSNEMITDKSKVFKVIFNDNSFICFRPSGTEALLKIYISTNALSRIEAQKKIEKYQSTIRKIIAGE